MRSSNVNPCAPVALGLLTLVFGLAACGSSAPTGQMLVDSTFSSHAPIERGVLGFTLAVDPVGANAHRSHSVELDVNGPFEGSEPGRLPSFAFVVQFSSGEHQIETDATAVGSQLFVRWGGSWFAAPDRAYKEIEQSYAQATDSPHSDTSYSSLGIEPRKWFVKPLSAGLTTIIQERTYHVVSGVNVRAFLRDAAKLFQPGRSLGSSIPGVSALTPAVVEGLAGSVRSAKLEIYLGKDDRVLRLLELVLMLRPSPQIHALLGGASEAKIELTVLFTKVNKPQTILAPPNPKPFSGLLPALQRALAELRRSGRDGEQQAHPGNRGPSRSGGRGA